VVGDVDDDELVFFFWLGLGLFAGSWKGEWWKKGRAIVRSRFFDASRFFSLSRSLFPRRSSISPLLTG
jgi:hypothetical protein